jgi:hypothetical protein
VTNIAVTECVFCCNDAPDGDVCDECLALQAGRPCEGNDWLIGPEWRKPDDLVVGEFHFTLFGESHSEPARRSQVDAIPPCVLGRPGWASWRQTIGDLRFIAKETDARIQR